MQRGPFQEALTWLEIHGQVPDVLEHWKGFYEGTVVPQEGLTRRGSGPSAAAAGDADGGAGQPMA